MTALIAAVFVASLIGSLHCAGMCGAFLAFAVGEGRPGERAALSAAYHGGRLLTYAALGASAGSVGALLDLGGALAGISRAAMVLAGAVMVLFGVSAAMAAVGSKPLRMPIPQVMQRVLALGHRAATKLTPVRRALMIGLITTLLPCGWLYAFAAVAAGTANPLSGVLTMAVFWLGTLPVMVSLGVGVQRLTGVVGRKLPHLAAVMLIGAGLWTLAGRSTLDANAIAADQAVYEDFEAARIGLSAAGQQTPDCCEVH